MEAAKEMDKSQWSRLLGTIYALSRILGALPLSYIGFLYVKYNSSDYAGTINNFVVVNKLVYKILLPIFVINLMANYARNRFLFLRYFLPDCYHQYYLIGRTVCISRAD